MSRLWIIAGVVLTAACAGRAGPQTAPATPDEPAVEIAATLRASAESWNAGDLDGFLDDYLDAPTTTFVGGSGVTRGVDRIRAGYLESYWKSGRPEHELRFEDLDVRRLGPDHALVVGRYVLTDRTTGGVASSGYFSLVWQRTERGWKIIHDHSSSAS